jgi:hypothetical protein
MPEPQAGLLQAAYGAQTAQLLYVAAKLGIADHLQHGNTSAGELARTLGVDHSALQLERAVDHFIARHANGNYRGLCRAAASERRPTVRER